MTIRETSLDGWSKAIVEEVLFLAAQQLSEGDPTADSGVEVTLTFRVTADVTANGLRLSVPSLTDDLLATTLTRPF